MKFKPTLTKTMVSILVGLVLTFLLFIYGTFQTACPEGLCPGIASVLWPPVITFVILTLLSYLIWSLATKR